MLTDCPVGWGHEPKASSSILHAAVETCFWPLYEVVAGRYRLTYEPAEKLPVEAWPRSQVRFKHLFEPGREDVLSAIQGRVDEEWATLRRRCAR